MGSVPPRRKQRGTQFGRGELFPPGYDEGLGYARGLFLAAVARLAPQVLRDLDRDVLGMLRRLPADHVLLTWLHEDLLGRNTDGRRGDISLSHPPDFAYPDLIPPPSCIADALADWAERYELDTTWVYSRSLVWLAEGLRGDSEADRLAAWSGNGIRWMGYGTPITSGYWHPGLTGPDWHKDTRHPKTFAFHSFDYDPTVQTRAEFIERTRLAFDEAINAHADRLERSLEQEGWTHPSVKRNLDHFDWLVRYQVLGESRRGIAGSLKRRKSTVDEPVNALADELGLRLRSGNEDYKGRRVA